MANEKDKKYEEEQTYRDVTIVGPAWALEPLTYVTEYLGDKGFRVALIIQGKPGGGGCVSTPGHPCQ